MNKLAQLLNQNQNTSGLSYRGRNPGNANHVKDQKARSTCGKCGVSGTHLYIFPKNKIHF